MKKGERLSSPGQINRPKGISESLAVSERGHYFRNMNG